MALDRTEYILLATAAVLVAVVAFWIWGDRLHTFGVSINSGLPTKTIAVGGVPVVVELATTAEQTEQGLSGRQGLPSGRGMLFDMGSDGQWGFWMKGMNFPIDMVWLTQSGAIVYIAANVSPDTYPQVFRPDNPARYVLELPAGYMAAAGVGVGDVVSL